MSPSDSDAPPPQSTSQPVPQPASQPASGTDANVARLIDFLAETDAPCPVCGYNLRGLLRPVCPECGSELALQVGAPRARFGNVLACLAPMLMMTGLTLFFIVMSMKYGPPAGPRAAWFWVLLIAGAVDGLLAAVVYGLRVRFMSQSPAVQQTLVFVSWFVNFGVFMLAVVIIR